jgi:signal transduction histidine kinase
VVGLLTTPERPAWLDALADAALLVLPVLYVAGYAGRRPSRAHVADLLLAVREEPDPARVRSLVARALGDPQAVVGWWRADAGDYRDHLGRRVDPSGEDVLTVQASGGPVAVVVSDRLDWVGPGVRESLGEALRLAAENRRLTAELQATLEQVRVSRARILTASDDARRRIERDLHDGAQQLLVSTGIKLNLAAARVGSGATEQELVGALEDASRDLGRALLELRQVAAGIAPAALVHGSLASALQDLALRGTVPTTVRVSGDADPDEATAATVYFVVAECLTNVAKHAHATRAAVDLVLDDPLRLTVSDDGRGGVVLDGAGSGLRGLVDRVDARGGSLGVESAGVGTTVTVVLPLHALELDQP